MLERMTYEDPSQVDADIVGIRDILGNRVVFHHTIRMKGMTYSGVHETEMIAITAFKSERRAGILDIAQEALNNKSAVPEELQVGQEYHPWGVGGTLTHGVDDETHDSPRTVTVNRGRGYLRRFC